MSLPSPSAVIEVLRPLDNKYYLETVFETNFDGKFFVNSDGPLFVNCDRQYFVISTMVMLRHSRSLSRNTTSLPCYFVQSSRFPSLQSNSSHILQAMLDSLGQERFLLHHAQVFPQYVQFNSYQAEGDEIRRHVKVVPISDLPKDANVISSYCV